MFRYLYPTTNQEYEMSDYVTDVKSYASSVNEAAVASIVKYCGIALQGNDSSLVSGTDPKELATVRDGFAAKKLGLSAEAADAGIKTVLEKMKGAHQKSRVTFYYLLAEATGTMNKLV
jgi:energy-coupling factor transporter ATP-binding protein EcfA2